MISRYSIAHESLFPNMKLSVAQEQTITSRDWGFSGESMQFMIWRDNSHTSGGKKQGMLQNKCDIRWFV